MEKICVIEAGGSITRKKDGSHFNVADLAPQIKEYADVDVVDLTRMTNKDRLYEGVGGLAAAALNGEYSGIVVTASAADIQLIAPRLAFSFGEDLNKPVVVTGNNISATNGLSDAREMILRAVMCAKSDVAEVMIAWQGLVLRGVDFWVSSPASNHLAYEPYRRKQELGDIAEELTFNSFARRIKKGVSAPNLTPAVFERNVGVIRIMPGLEPEMHEKLLRNSRGIVILTPGDLVLPNEDKYSWESVLRRFTERGVPVVLANVQRNDAVLKNGEDHIYSGSEGARQVGIGMRSINSLVAIIKLSWVLGLVEQDVVSGLVHEGEKMEIVREMMLRNHYGEFGSVKF